MANQHLIKGLCEYQIRKEQSICSQHQILEKTSTLVLNASVDESTNKLSLQLEPSPAFPIHAGSQ
ncbi:hypothetical protein TMatcc_010249 [Talaromyces marneffei ATCC 18224]